MIFSNPTICFAKVPEGYIAIPIAEDQKIATIKICALVKSNSDPVGGHLIVLRDTIGAKVFLGCIIDASSQVLDWIELWIQNTESLMNSASAASKHLTNATLDNLWYEQSQAFENLVGSAVIKTGWESQNPLPTFLNITTRSPIHPKDTNSGNPWKLCVDEDLLQQKNLPGYAGSLHRFLYITESGGESPFVPVTSGAPTNASTKPLSEICEDSGNIIPLNIRAGFILIKKHFPIRLETFIDILSGAAWDGLKHGRSILDLGEKFNVLRKDEAFLSLDGRLFLESHDRCDRLIETFHLKLKLFADVVSSAHSMIYQLQRPLLNLSPDSVQVKLGEPGCGLPFLWTARAVINDPGNAVPLVIKQSDLQYFLPAFENGTSIYRPIVTSLPTRGRASVRIRQILPDTSDTTTIEGTFTTNERIDMAKNDLVCFRLNLACGEINLYARLEADTAMAPGEWRFRTVAQKIDDTKVSDLRAAEGVPIPEVLFEIIPLLSSPCDLYSLAVIAIRILLVDNTNSLPVVLDETLSLPRLIEAGYDESSSLEARICNIFNNDKRWFESLGPHHLTLDEITPEEAFSFIPPELWWTTLAIILRMFPGLGSEAVCEDYGDAQPGGLHKIFERTIADLDSLILKTRSLIVTNWKSNQEISDAIRKYIT